MAEKLYALDNLKNMIGDDESTIKEFIQVFIDQSKQSLELLNKKLEEKNFLEVGKLAHKLKSSIDLMRIEKLRNVVRETETIGKEGQPNELLNENVSYINEILEQVIYQINKDFKL